MNKITLSFLLAIVTLSCVNSPSNKETAQNITTAIQNRYSSYSTPPQLKAFQNVDHSWTG